MASLRSCSSLNNFIFRLIVSLGATFDVAPQLSAEQVSQGSFSASDLVRFPVKHTAAEAAEGDKAAGVATGTSAAAPATVPVSVRAVVPEVVVLQATRARMLLLNFVFLR